MFRFTKITFLIAIVSFSNGYATTSPCNDAYQIKKNELTQFMSDKHKELMVNHYRNESCTLIAWEIAELLLKLNGSPVIISFRAKDSNNGITYSSGISPLIFQGKAS